MVFARTSWRCIVAGTLGFALSLAGCGSSLSKPSAPPDGRVQAKLWFAEALGTNNACEFWRAKQALVSGTSGTASELAMWVRGRVAEHCGDAVAVGRRTASSEDETITDSASFQSALDACVAKRTGEGWELDEMSRLEGAQVALAQYQRQEGTRIFARIDAVDRTGCSKASLESNSMQPIYSLSQGCLLYTSPSPRDRQKSRMPSSA